jgi:hypothetical protein
LTNNYNNNNINSSIIQNNKKLFSNLVKDSDKKLIFNFDKNNNTNPNNPNIIPDNRMLHQSKSDNNLNNRTTKVCNTTSTNHFIVDNSTSNIYNNRPTTHTVINVNDISYDPPLIDSNNRLDMTPTNNNTTSFLTSRIENDSITHIDKIFNPFDLNSNLDINTDIISNKQNNILTDRILLESKSNNNCTYNLNNTITNICNTTDMNDTNSVNLTSIDYINHPLTHTVINVNNNSYDTVMIDTDNLIDTIPINKNKTSNLNIIKKNRSIMDIDKNTNLSIPNSNIDNIMNINSLNLGGFPDNRILQQSKTNDIFIHTDININNNSNNITSRNSNNLIDTTPTNNNITTNLNNKIANESILDNDKRINSTSINSGLNNFINHESKPYKTVTFCLNNNPINLSNISLTNNNIVNKVQSNHSVNQSLNISMSNLNNNPLKTTDILLNKSSDLNTTNTNISTQHINIKENKSTIHIESKSLNITNTFSNNNLSNISSFELNNNHSTLNTYNCSSKTKSSNNRDFFHSTTDNNSYHTLSSFSTTIYRKPTYTGLLTKWKSYVPHSYKISTISSMAYRAIRICSSYKQLHEEFEFIEFISELNGYPINFIKAQIRKTLNRYIEKKNSIKTHTLKDKTTNNIDTSAKKKRIILDIPFIGEPSNILKKQISKIAKNIDSEISFQAIERPPITLARHFPIKDQIPNLLKSNVVYKLNCLNCEASYIGKTCRHVKKRFLEHGAKLNKAILTNTVSNDINDISLTLRRSDRNKNKTVNYSYKPTTDISNPELIEQTKSAVKQHENTNNHKIDWNNFKIIARDDKNYHLLVKESLLINNFKPSLNQTITSVPLIIFPEGLQAYKPRVKIKLTLDQSPLVVV